MRTQRVIIILVVLALVGNLSIGTVWAEEDAWRKLGTKSTPEEIAIGGTWTTDLMVDPQNPRHIIATSFWPSIKQSWNGGGTWENVNLYEDHANMLATRILYVDGIWYFNSWGYIFKTQDWKTFEDVMTSKTSGWKAHDATIPGYDAPNIDDFWTDGQTFYLGMRAGDNKCLFLSINGGKTWTDLSSAVLQAVGTISTLGVDRLFVFKSLLFIRVGLTSQWLVSSDTGKTFKEVIGYGTDYAFLDVVGDEIWLTWQKKNTIQSSLNGIDWQMINENAPAITGFSWPSPVRFLYDKKTGMVFASAKKQVVYSRDMGKTWMSYSEGLSTNTLAIWPPDGILCLSGDTLYLSLGEDVYTRSTPPVIQKSMITFTIGSKIYVANGVSITMETPPVIVNSRTFLPIRYVAEPLGAQVGWDAKTRRVTITLGLVNLELWIGKNVARVNGRNVAIDSADAKVVPYITSGRTMLPLRFVSENIGCAVLWTDATKTITITYNPSK